MASVAAGAGLLMLSRRHRGMMRNTAAATGSGLIARGISGYCPVNAATGRGLGRGDTRQELGGPRGVNLQESLTIDAPIETLFDLWRDPANLPQLLPYVERVDVLDERRSHWTVRGPAGARLEWDAEIINEVPNDTIGWQSLPGGDVASAGSVRFRPAGLEGTEVTVTMQYAPPAGKAGAAIAWLTGRSASGMIREALRQLKQRLEAGETPTVAGQPEGRRSRKFAAARAIS